MGLARRTDFERVGFLETSRRPFSAEVSFESANQAVVCCRDRAARVRAARKRRPEDREAVAHAGGRRTRRHAVLDRGGARQAAANPRVRIKARDGLRGRWYSGTAHILADDDPHTRQRWLATQVRGAGRNAAAVRFFGTELLTVRIDLDE